MGSLGGWKGVHELGRREYGVAGVSRRERREKREREKKRVYRRGIHYLHLNVQKKKKMKKISFFTHTLYIP